jgi:hypothetical protein
MTNVEHNRTVEKVLLENIAPITDLDCFRKELTNKVFDQLVSKDLFYFHGMKDNDLLEVHDLKVQYENFSFSSQQEAHKDFLEILVTETAMSLDRKFLKAIISKSLKATWDFFYGTPGKTVGDKIKGLCEFLANLEKFQKFDWLITSPEISCILKGSYEDYDERELNFGESLKINYRGILNNKKVYTDPLFDVNTILFGRNSDEESGLQCYIQDLVLLEGSKVNSKYNTKLKGNNYQLVEITNLIQE